MSVGTRALSEAGVSIWLDDLSRDRIASGSLATLIDTQDVVGVTTNPAIFSAAITGDTSYDQALTEYAALGLTADEAITRMTTEDVRQACDVLHTVFERTDGRDGRVSIEVEPALAHNTDETVARARELWDLVDRDNAMIKIPATRAGLPAISATIAQGISVNVTLIFSLQRYREVINAYLSGIELARERGLDISRIHSVASFFVSRLDSAVDPAFDASNDPAIQANVGKIAIANASAAYEIFEEQFSSVRGKYLVSQGANVQRLLWASTGVKDARFESTLYVTELVAPQTVNTMPEATLTATAGLTEIRPNGLRDHAREAVTTLAGLTAVDLDYAEVTDTLEQEGLEKFEVAWNELVASVAQRLES